MFHIVKFIKQFLVLSIIVKNIFFTTCVKELHQRLEYIKQQRGIMLVIVEKADRLLPYWGTPTAKKLLDPVQWPKVYSQRTDIQENSFKGMIAHGGLNVNFGTKKIIVPDRHQERKKEKLEEKLASTNEKIKAKEENVKDQENKVKDSQDKGHGKHLEQRQENLSKRQAELEETKNKKNLLKLFLLTLHEKIDIKVSLESLISLKNRYQGKFGKSNIIKK